MSKTIMMDYDAENHGIYIFISDSTASGGSHWWFDWRLKTYWPMELPGDHEPFSIVTHAGERSGDHTVLLGCRDGYIRNFSEDFETDDGTEIDAEVYIGPIKLGGTESRIGLLKEMVAVVSEGSGDIAWSVHVGQSAQAALDAGSFDVSGTFKDLTDGGT